MLSSRNIGEFNYIIRDKNASIINAHARGYLFRKKLKIIYAIRYKCSNRIKRAFRRYFKGLFAERDRAALKIQLLFRKNHSIKKKEQLLINLTMNWFPKKEPSRTFAATTIQRYWKLYRNKQIYKYCINKNPKIDSSLLKIKVCTTCGSQSVSYLCTDCNDSYYCDHDFKKYHNRGPFKNHSFIVIKEVFEKKKTQGIGLNLDNMKLRDYLKANKISLFDHLRMWDFSNNSLILYKHLKDALSSKFFNMKEQFKNILLNFAYQFLLAESDLTNVDECYVKYEELCLDLV